MNKDRLEKLLEHIQIQIDYCEMRSQEDVHAIDAYSKDEKMTPEQMSGYYQGRGEANWAILHQIQDILNE